MTDKMTMLEAINLGLKDAMENVFESIVPLTVDIGEGATWLEAH